jgi:hypothetical protein
MAIELVETKKNGLLTKIWKKKIKKIKIKI